ncbi:MAG: DUF3781 domain-containing protein [Ruminococcus sp.]|nr:DUF3781 domain-containing protein [Ruminococcus sp.]
MNQALPFSPDKLCTTEMGAERIRHNLTLSDETDPVIFCRELIISENCRITRRGKNFYCETDGVCVTVNAGRLTIITAHKI